MSIIYFELNNFESSSFFFAFILSFSPKPSKLLKVFILLKGELLSAKSSRTEPENIV
jgi:hypothetical protein